MFQTHQYLQIADPCKTQTVSQFLGRGLVMACLNINSLVSHIDDLHILISQFKDIDILAINETKLDSNIKDSEVHLPGYEVVRKDRDINGRNGGGVCIYVRSNINFQLRADLSLSNLECLTIEITKPAQSHSLCLPGTDHHNHLLTSFLPLRELLIKLTPKIWSYIFWAI